MTEKQDINPELQADLDSWNQAMPDQVSELETLSAETNAAYHACALSNTEMKIFLCMKAILAYMALCEAKGAEGLTKEQIRIGISQDAIDTSNTA